MKKWAGAAAALLLFAGAASAHRLALRKKIECSDTMQDAFQISYCESHACQISDASA